MTVWVTVLAHYTSRYKVVIYLNISVTDGGTLRVGVGAVRLCTVRPELVPCCRKFGARITGKLLKNYGVCNI